MKDIYTICLKILKRQAKKKKKGKGIHFKM